MLLCADCLASPASSPLPGLRVRLHFLVSRGGGGVRAAPRSVRRGVRAPSQVGLLEIVTHVTLGVFSHQPAEWRGRQSSRGPG